MRVRQWQLERTVLQCVADRPDMRFGIQFDLGWLTCSQIGPFLLSTDSECEQFLAKGADDELRAPDFQLSEDPFAPNFLKLVTRLQKASIREPRGPIDGVQFVVSGRSCDVRYRWIQDQIDEFHETEGQSDGIPFFVVMSDFSERVVTRVRSRDVYSIMLTIGRLVFLDAEHYPRPLVEACAIVDWLADTRNGAFDQYFARKKVRLTRTEVYSFVLSGLQRIGQDAGADLFCEGIAIYSHFEPEIEKARSSMGIERVPRVSESDIMSRFYHLHREIESRLADHFVAQPTEFAVPEWKHKWSKL